MLLRFSGGIWFYSHWILLDSIYYWSLGRINWVLLVTIKLQHNLYFRRWKWWEMGRLDHLFYRSEAEAPSRWVTCGRQSRSLAQSCPLCLTKETSCKDCCIWWLLKHACQKSHKEIKRRNYKWKTDLPKYISQRLITVIDKKCHDKNNLKSAERSGQRAHFVYSQKRKYKW